MHALTSHETNKGNIHSYFIEFLCELGHRLKAETGEQHSLQFLFQRISLAMQRGNTAAMLDTIKGNHTDYSG